MSFLFLSVHHSVDKVLVIQVAFVTSKCLAHHLLHLFVAQAIAHICQNVTEFRSGNHSCESVGRGVRTWGVTIWEGNLPFPSLSNTWNASITPGSEVTFCDEEDIISMKPFFVIICPARVTGTNGEMMALAGGKTTYLIRI